GALRDKNELLSDAKQPLFTSALAIPESHPITRALLVDASQTDALGSLLRSGKVAVSFEIDRAHGVGGWVRPGDVIALYTSGKNTGLLYPAVPVVAVDNKRLGHGAEKPRQDSQAAEGVPDIAEANGSKVLTVIVNPLEASGIIEAREEGALSVVL